MKVFKKLAGLCLALTLCSGICAFAACGESDPADSTPSVNNPVGATGYKFKIVNADGTPASNVGIQLCTLKPDGTLDLCKAPVMVDAKGEVLYEVEAMVYEIHVFDYSTGSAHMNYESETTTTSATYNSDVIVLTLAE